MNTCFCVYLCVCVCLGSDGGARTGVYLAVDSNLELHEEDGKLDVYGYVKRMKQARPGLIETVVSVPSLGAEEGVEICSNHILLSSLISWKELDWMAFLYFDACNSFSCRVWIGGLLVLRCL